MLAWQHKSTPIVSFLNWRCVLCFKFNSRYPSVTVLKFRTKSILTTVRGAWPRNGIRPPDVVRTVQLPLPGLIRNNSVTSVKFATSVLHALSLPKATAIHVHVCLHGLVSCGSWTLVSLTPHHHPHAMLALYRLKLQWVTRTRGRNSTHESTFSPRFWSDWSMVAMVFRTSCLVSVYESTMKVNNCLQNCCFFGESCKMFPSDLKITQDSPAGNGLTILKQNHCDDRWDRRSPECCSRGFLDWHGKVDTCFRSGLESWLQFISFILCSIIHQKY